MLRSNPAHKETLTQTQVEQQKGLSLFRQEVMVTGKDGQYPAVQATFDSLTNLEKSELFRLVKELGFPEEQLRDALEKTSRNSVIVLIFNKEHTKAIGTGQVNLMKEFGTANKDLGVSRLGTVGISYAYVEEGFRGKHLGKELLRLRFEVVASGYFHNWVQQTAPKDLKLEGQTLDGKPVTKKMLLSATSRENTIFYCDLRDEKAHFGRTAQAAGNVGMEITNRSKENMKPYAQMSVLKKDDYLLLYVYTGVTVNSVGGRQMLSRKNTLQPIYFYGNRKLREKIATKVGQRLLAAGAQYNENSSYYSGVPAELIWQMVAELSSSTEYETLLDQPHIPATTDTALARYGKSKKLHMVSIKAYDTHRLSLGFPK